MIPMNIKLSNLATATLGLYLGFKPSYRPKEAERYGIDFVAGAEALFAEIGPIKVTKKNRGLLYQIFNNNIGTERDCMASQTHCYMNKLGFYSELDLMFNKPMEKLDALTIR